MHVDLSDGTEERDLGLDIYQVFNPEEKDKHLKEKVPFFGRNFFIFVHVFPGIFSKTLLQRLS